MSARGADLVVLTYDGRTLLDATMPSVLAQRCPDGTRPHVILVDNGSSDGTADHVRDAWPQVEVIRLAENVGVTPALNRGLGAARAPLVALLNNDVELAPGWLCVLTTSLERYPKAGSACGKLLDYADRTVVDGAGDTLHWSGAAGRRGHGEIDRGQYDQPAEVLGACGGAALYRRDALEDVGGFDERYQAYYEDVDWSLRAQLLGWGCRYEPGAIGFHMGSATTQPTRNLGYWRLQRRNLPLVVAKCFPAATLVRQAHRIIGFELIWLARSARAGLLGLHLRALGEAVRELPAVLPARRELQRRRRVSLAELAHLIRA